MTTTGTFLFLVYEPGHIPALEARLKAGETGTVVALDYEVELELKKRDIQFIPLCDLSVSPDGDRDLLEHIRALALTWYTAPEMDFFRYDGILLGEQHEVIVLYYLETLVYYLSVLDQVFANIPDIKRISIPSSSHYLSNTVDPVDLFKERLPVDVTRLLAKRRGIECEVIPPPVSQQVRNAWFDDKKRVLQFIFRIAVRTANTLVTFFRKPRPIKLFASDPWYRLEPFVKNMNDAELVMTRRKEMKEMGWRNIWQTRSRFHHRSDFIDATIRTLAKENAQKIACAWDTLGDNPALSAPFSYKGISFWPLAKEMFDSLVKNHTEDAILTIENTKELLKRYGINCVLLFSSTKGYNNVIANVAEGMGIPSIELQHALSTTEASSPHTRLHSRYLAAYGASTKRIYENVGIESWRLIECGSPRFDHYAHPLDAGVIEALRTKLHLDSTHLNVLINVPQIHSSLEFVSYTSYEVARILEEYAELQRKHPKMRFLLRPRPGPLRQSFYRREEIWGLFKGDTRNVQYEDLHTLLTLSDIAIFGNTTMVLEAMILRRPVLMYVPKIIDKEFQEFEDAGAVLMARTEDELHMHTVFLSDKRNRDLLVTRADAFLERNFKLDGKSSERMTALIRRVSSVQ